MFYAASFHYCRIKNHSEFEICGIIGSRNRSALADRRHGKTGRILRRLLNEDAFSGEKKGCSRPISSLIDRVLLEQAEGVHFVQKSGITYLECAV